MKKVACRKINKIDINLFKQDIQASELCTDPMDDLDLLVDQYNQCLSNILDKHAPLIERFMENKTKQPWNCDRMCNLRKLERAWRKSQNMTVRVSFKAQ